MRMKWFRLPQSVLALVLAVNASHHPRQAFTNSSAISTSTASSKAPMMNTNRLGTANTYISDGTLTATNTTAEAANAFADNTASTTKLANPTRPDNATITARPEGNCCYIRPNAVGVNSWWSSSIGVPVQTVITTWLQYNHTRFPANSTTINVSNATSMVGWYSWTITTVSTSWPLSTVTMPTTTMTVAVGGPSFIYDYATNSSRISGVPNTLLPSNAQMYASSQVLPATTMAYDLQSMTFTSPTPWLWYSQIYVGISAQCNATTPGHPATEKAIMPTSTVVQSIPNEDGSAFAFSKYLEEHGMIREGDGSNLYHFALPADLPSLLAGIPEVAATWPNIGSCTNLIGQGEPTVHIPVDQLTVMSDVTITMRNTITDGGQQTSTTGIDTSPTSAAPGSPPDQPGASATSTPTPVSPDDSNSGSQPGQTQQPDDTPEQSSGGGTPTNVNTVGLETLISAIDDAADSADEGDGASLTTFDAIGDAIASVIGLVQSQATTGIAQLGVSATPVPIEGSIVEDAAPGQFELEDQAQPVPVITAVENSISIGPDGTAVIVNNALMPTAAATPKGTMAGSTDIASADVAIVLGTQTLQPDSAIVSAGTTFSLEQDGSAVVINGVTIPTSFATIIDAQYALEVDSIPASVTIGGEVVTAGTGNRYVVGPQTLTPGSTIEISGTTYSLASDASDLFVNGQATPIDIPGATASISAAIGGITAASNTLGFTALGQDSVEIESQTLGYGNEYGTIVIDGNTLSLINPSQVLLVSGTITSTLDLNPTTTVVVTRTRAAGSSATRATETFTTENPLATSNGARLITKVHMCLVGFVSVMLLLSTL